jgi:DNA-directed RNA polymerase specialized sigma24 family protein
MPPQVTADSFRRLLAALDPDAERAGSRYEELRRTLIRFFEWRGAPYPEEHADETFDRVSKKLAGGLAIANIGGYCYEVARLVCLEALKPRASQVVPLDGSPTRSIAAPSALPPPIEARLACLERCLAELPPDQRDLILDYYRDDGRARIERRKALADRFGVPRETLANRAQRLRDRLERCVALCLERRGAIWKRVDGH